MTVSLCVIAYNEEKFLPHLLNDILNQTYPHNLTEIILVDGRSEDNTKSIMNNFKEKNQSDYRSIKVLTNNKRIQASGWNVAITSCECDVIIRIDAHAHITAEFTEKNMQLQETGEYVTGGVRLCIIEEPTDWKNVLLEVENSMFGSSIAASRHKIKRKYVKTMFHAAYRKEVFENAGQFNEKLRRTEDNEMHYRIRKSGYKFCCDPDIVTYQYARSSLKEMVKQKFGNGYWVGLTLGVCSKCLSVYHFIPFAFLVSIFFTTLLSFWGIWQFALIMWSAYLLFALVSMIKTVINGKGNKWTFSMPFLFLILHISYGFGTLCGLINIPTFKREVFSNDKKNNP
ncbi:MAG: glycosyltransferase [Eubacterium sp.]|nr:glycosyltransferase [Eubacterium sp.]